MPRTGKRLSIEAVGHASISPCFLVRVKVALYLTHRRMDEERKCWTPLDRIIREIVPSHPPKSRTFAWRQREQLEGLVRGGL